MQQAAFEHVIGPHLEAAYNLARWLLKADQDAQDVVQEAYLRAFRFFPSFRGDNARAWLLSIVRRCCYDWLASRRPTEVLNEDMPDLDQDPERRALASFDAALVGKALEAMPAEFREVLILREMEEMSYKEIASVVGLPIGTVMSRLTRARTRLKHSLEGAAR